MGEAKLKEALQMFADGLTAGDNVSFSDITHLNSQLSALSESKIKGILSQSEINLTENIFQIGSYRS